MEDSTPAACKMLQHACPSRKFCRSDRRSETSCPSATSPVTTRPQHRALRTSYIPCPPPARALREIKTRLRQPTAKSSCTAITPNPPKPPVKIYWASNPPSHGLFVATPPVSRVSRCNHGRYVVHARNSTSWYDCVHVPVACTPDHATQLVVCASTST
jgi:hypothetical protein